MARFRDIKTPQKFASVHASIHSHFNHQHHLNRRNIFQTSPSPDRLAGLAGRGAGAGRRGTNMMPCSKRLRRTGQGGEARAAFDPIYRSRVETHRGVCRGTWLGTCRVRPLHHARGACRRVWIRTSGRSARSVDRADVSLYLHAGHENARRDARRRPR